MEQHLCIVCGKPYDTGALLLDQRLKKSFDMKTVTAVDGLCEEHQKLYDDGYIALVEVNNKESTTKDNTLNQSETSRTGKLVHIKFELAANLFNVTLKRNGGKNPPMVFVDEKVVAALEGRLGKSQQQD